HAFLLCNEHLAAVATPSLGLDRAAIEQVRSAVASLLLGWGFFRFQLLWLAGGWLYVKSFRQIALVMAPFGAALASIATVMWFDLPELWLQALVALVISSMAC